ncbi:hypothetical protein [Corynebacterium cystitidis]|nr:hypothetical protein [Corynebacterium cystitidis]
MRLLDRLETHRDHRTKTDVALANEILANPVDAVLWRGVSTL